MRASLRRPSSASPSSSSSSSSSPSSIRLARILGVPESIEPSLDAPSRASTSRVIVVVAARARTSLVPDVVLLTVVLVLDGIDIVTAIVVFDAAPIAIAIAIASPSRAAARGGRRGEVRWRGGFHGSGLKHMCGLVPRGGVARVAIEGVHEGLEGGPDRDPF